MEEIDQSSAGALAFVGVLGPYLWLGGVALAVAVLAVVAARALRA